MSTFSVVVKHAGTRYNVELDPTSTGEVFKYQLYSLTGVEPERQKILIKGGVLKDDVLISSLNIKPNQTLLMMGTPLDKSVTGPIEKPVFLEDMTDEQRAHQRGATPAGLQNLGNTCYMNATLQTLRFVPELQKELARYRPTSAAAPGALQSQLMNAGIAAGLFSSGDLTHALKDLYKSMGSTTEGVPPLVFLRELRSAFPQFAQKVEGRYAQQDAEECFSQLVSRLKQNLKIKPEGEGTAEVSFVDKYMSLMMASTLKLEEHPEGSEEEPVVETTETLYKLSCHITGTTNFMRDGILSGLTEKITKNSPTLGRDATYVKASRVTRLPKYLTCHFVRFYWKREINKKAKIMRKVTFPFELDATEFCSDDLKAKLVPVRDKIRDLRKDLLDRMRAKKRVKRSHDGTVNTHTVSSSSTPTTSTLTPAADGDVTMEGTAPSSSAEAPLPDWEAEVKGLVDPELLKDDGLNVTGLYELLAIITHQGASADSGHYCAYVKKSAVIAGLRGDAEEEDGDDSKLWYFFNDDRVSEVTEEKIEMLAGGGESHSALICLYKAVGLGRPKGGEGL